MMVLWLMACGSVGPDAVCERLENAGVARRCRLDREDARQTSWQFDLIGGGSHGMVYAYADSDAQRAAFDGRKEVAALFREHGQEPWHFDARQHRLTVMLVHGASEQARAKTQQVVDAL